MWNEPNLRSVFWGGDQAEYSHLYKETAESVKSVSADYRVGGPATAANGWVPEMIKYCSENKVPLDFITTHTYGSDKPIQSTNNDVVTISANGDPIPSNIINTKLATQRSEMPSLPLNYTEWGSTASFNDPFHDHYSLSSFVLDKIKKTGDAAATMSYWTFTDIFEESGPRITPFHGGFGLINYQDIPQGFDSPWG